MSLFAFAYESELSNRIKIHRKEIPKGWSNITLHLECFINQGCCCDQRENCKLTNADRRDPREYCQLCSLIN